MIQDLQKDIQQVKNEIQELDNLSKKITPEITNDSESMLQEDLGDNNNGDNDRHEAQIYLIHRIRISIKRT